VCDKCVYRRDHHCFVLGACIGAHNQAFFIFLMVHLAMGAAVAAYHSAKHLESVYGFWSQNRHWEYCVVMQFYRVIAGDGGNVHAAMITLLFNVSLFFSISLGNFTIFQIFLILRGQTQIEFLQARKTVTGSMYQAWLRIFGPRWYLRLIFPFQSSHVLSLAVGDEKIV
jgi:palmitoyltransferase